jgi:NAD(P)-dependent dehydrogenase (short-subunit alcohol dehydrogenase family)
MCSVIVETGLTRRVSYAASKGAVLALTRAMEVDLAPHGVRVNALMPGTIMTPFVERYLEEWYADPEEGRRSFVADSSPESSAGWRISRTPRSISPRTSRASYWAQAS